MKKLMRIVKVKIKILHISKKHVLVSKLIKHWLDKVRKYSTMDKNEDKIIRNVLIQSRFYFIYLLIIRSMYC